MNTRRRVLTVLEAVDAGERYASDLLQTDEAPFVREVVTGVLRRRATLDAIHDAYGNRPTGELDTTVRAAVRAGLYQLVFLDGVPPHAAVSETAGAVRLHSQRAYVNAVLRRVVRECNKVPPDRDRGGAHPAKRFERPGRSVSFFSRKVFPDPAVDEVGYLAAVHSHPAFLVQRWLDRVGKEVALEWMERGNRVPPLILRARRGRVDAAGLVERLAAESVVAGVRPREHGEDAVEVASGARGVLSGASWKAGLFSVQDVDQMDAVEVLDPKAGEVVWDACAAPGGKTAQLAEHLDGSGRIVATDRSPARLARVSESLDRLGLPGVECAVHDVLSDAEPPGRPPRGFDAILLDAPCSNTAVLASRPEARWRLEPGTPQTLGAVQRQMIEAARRHLAPDGRLVFSSCSREPEEGEAHGLQPTRSPLVWVGS